MKENALDPTASELGARLLREHRLRVEPEMAAYLARRLGEVAGDGSAVPLIGGEARTGVPVQLLVDPRSLLTEHSELS